MPHYRPTRPVKRLTTKEEVQVVLDRYHAGTEPVTLYGVTQMGYVEPYELIPSSKIIYEPYATGDGGIHKVDCLKTSTLEGDKKYQWDFFLESFGIVEDAYATEFALFEHEADALAYSELLKADERYITSVKEHWAMCDELFEGLDYAYEYEYEEKL